MIEKFIISIFQVADDSTPKPNSTTRVRRGANAKVKVCGERWSQRRVKKKQEQEEREKEKEREQEAKEQETPSKVSEPELNSVIEKENKVETPAVSNITVLTALTPQIKKISPRKMKRKRGWVKGRARTKISDNKTQLTLPELIKNKLQKDSESESLISEKSDEEITPNNNITISPTSLEKRDRPKIKDKVKRTSRISTEEDSSAEADDEMENDELPTPKDPSPSSKYKYAKLTPTKDPPRISLSNKDAINNKLISNRLEKPKSPLYTTTSESEMEIDGQKIKTISHKEVYESTLVIPDLRPSEPSLTQNLKDNKVDMKPDTKLDTTCTEEVETVPEKVVEIDEASLDSGRKSTDMEIEKVEHKDNIITPQSQPIGEKEDKNIQEKIIRENHIDEKEVRDAVAQITTAEDSIMQNAELEIPKQVDNLDETQEDPKKEQQPQQQSVIYHQHCEEQAILKQKEPDQMDIMPENGIQQKASEGESEHENQNTLNESVPEEPKILLNSVEKQAVPVIQNVSKEIPVIQNQFSEKGLNQNVDEKHVQSVEIKDKIAQQDVNDKLSIAEPCRETPIVVDRAEENSVIQNHVQVRNDKQLEEVPQLNQPTVSSVDQDEVNNKSICKANENTLTCNPGNVRSTNQELTQPQQPFASSFSTEEPQTPVHNDPSILNKSDDRSQIVNQKQPQVPPPRPPSTPQQESKPVDKYSPKEIKTSPLSDHKPCEMKDIRPKDELKVSPKLEPVKSECRLKQEKYDEKRYHTKISHEEKAAYEAQAKVHMDSESLLANAMATQNYHMAQAQYHQWQWERLSWGKGMRSISYFFAPADYFQISLFTLLIGSLHS